MEPPEEGSDVNARSTRLESGALDRHAQNVDNGATDAGRDEYGAERLHAIIAINVIIIIETYARLSAANSPWFYAH